VLLLRNVSLRQTPPAFSGRARVSTIECGGHRKVVLLRRPLSIAAHAGVFQPHERVLSLPEVLVSLRRAHQ
jgi:hypothetical protein